MWSIWVQFKSDHINRHLLYLCFAKMFTHLTWKFFFPPSDHTMVRMKHISCSFQTNDVIYERACQVLFYCTFALGCGRRMNGLSLQWLFFLLKKELTNRQVINICLYSCSALNSNTKSSNKKVLFHRQVRLSIINLSRES